MPGTQLPCPALLAGWEQAAGPERHSWPLPPCPCSGAPELQTWSEPRPRRPGSAAELDWAARMATCSDNPGKPASKGRLAWVGRRPARPHRRRRHHHHHNPPKGGTVRCGQPTPPTHLAGGEGGHGPQVDMCLLSIHHHVDGAGGDKLEVGGVVVKALAPVVDLDPGHHCMHGRRRSGRGGWGVGRRRSRHPGHHCMHGRRQGVACRPPGQALPQEAHHWPHACNPHQWLAAVPTSAHPQGQPPWGLWSRVREARRTHHTPAQPPRAVPRALHPTVQKLPPSEHSPMPSIPPTPRHSSPTQPTCVYPSPHLHSQPSWGRLCGR